MNRRPGYNPTRRNRNIGTAKQGHGLENKMSIPRPSVTAKFFYERLGDYKRNEIEINGKKYIFVIETTLADSQHACSIEDVARVLEFIPPADLEGLDLIVFRQPKRKEWILSSVWGRLIYCYEFEKRLCPAIILEAVDYTEKIRWKKRFSVDDRRELQCLIEDGHPIIDTGRFYEAPCEHANVRNTQLFRTLPHEIGHYLDYLNHVELPAKAGADTHEEWSRLRDVYNSRPASEKERFAHDYANQKRKILLDSGWFGNHRSGPPPPQ